MQIIDVNIQLREKCSTSALRSMRNLGWVPAVIYGKENKQTLSIKMDYASVKKEISKHSLWNFIFQLQFPDGTMAKTILKDVQRNPIGGVIRHMDFIHVSMTEEAEFSVDIVLTNDTIRTKKYGGLLEHLHRTVNIKCLIQDVPDKIELDISDLAQGHGIYFHDLPSIPNVKYLFSDPDQLVVHTVAHKTATEEAEESTKAEPEVIGKGKKEVKE